VELEPGDGRGGETAGCRDADELRELAGHWVALQRSDDARRDDEDRCDCGERELEAGVEQRVRVPGEEDGRTDEQGLPAISLSRGQPGERPERGRERRAHDGRMEPHRECVRGDREQGCDLSEVAPEAGEKDDAGDPAANGSHLQPVHREAVVEAGGAEIAEQRLVEAGRAAEDDRLDHVAPLACQAGGAVAGQPAPDAVADSRDAAAPTRDTPVLRAQDCVDALPAQPFRLVEAVRRPGRSSQLADEPQARPLLWCPAERKLEQDRLVRPQSPPAEHECAHPLVEASRPRRLLDLDERGLERADPSCEGAPVELVESHAPPAPAGGHEGGRDRGPPHARVDRRETDRTERHGGEQRGQHAEAPEVRESATQTEGAHEGVRETNAHVTGSPGP
jgi:hypothetical protein